MEVPRGNKKILIFQTVYSNHLQVTQYMCNQNSIYSCIFLNLCPDVVPDIYILEFKEVFFYQNFTLCIKWLTGQKQLDII